jgi:hypothetical protein
MAPNNRNYSFKGRQVNQVLARFEIECKRDNVPESERCELFSLEVEPALWDQVTGLRSFKINNWSQLKTDLKELFVDEEELARYLPSDLETLVNSTKRSHPPSTYGEIMRFKLEFSKIASHLKERNLLSEADETRLFLQALDSRIVGLLEANASAKRLAEKVILEKLPSALREQFPNLADNSADLDAFKMPALKDVMGEIKAVFEATHAYSGGRTNEWMASRNSATYAAENARSDRNDRRQADRTVRFQEGERDGRARTPPPPTNSSEDLQSLTRQLSELKLAFAELVNPAQAKQETHHQHAGPSSNRPAPSSSPSPATWPNSIKPSRDCIFCNGPHYKRECPPLKDWIRSGKLVDNGRVAYADGQEVRRQGHSSMLAAVESKFGKLDSPSFHVNSLIYVPPKLDLPKIDAYEVNATLCELDSDDEEADDAYMAAAAKRGRASNDSAEGQPPKKRPEIEVEVSPLADIRNTQARYQTRRQTGGSRPNLQEPAAEPPEDVHMKDAQQTQKMPRRKLVSEVGIVGVEERVWSKIKETEVSLPIESILAISPDLSKRVKDACTRKRIPIEEVNKVRAEANSLTFEAHSNWYQAEPPPAIYSSALAYTNIGIAGQEVRTLIDGGAQVNLISKQLQEKLGLPIRTDGHHFLRGSSGVDVPMAGICEDVKIKVAGLEFRIHLWVLDNPNSDLVLGAGFLYDSSATMEYNLNEQVLLTLKQDRKVTTLCVTPANKELFKRTLPGMHVDPLEAFATQSKN